MSGGDEIALRRERKAGKRSLVTTSEGDENPPPQQIERYFQLEREAQDHTSPPPLPGRSNVRHQSATPAWTAYQKHMAVWVLICDQRRLPQSPAASTETLRRCRSSSATHSAIHTAVRFRPPNTYTHAVAVLIIPKLDTSVLSHRSITDFESRV